MSELILEKKLTDAFMALISEDDGYIKNENIHIRDWGDNSARRELPCVIVRCGRIKPHNGNKSIYECDVDFLCATSTVDDSDRLVLNSIYENVLGVLHTITAGDITDAIGGGITVDGFYLLEGDSDISDDGSLQQLTAKITVFLNVL